ncbi:uncharacterized protein LOC128550070 [Mercenaria mercenaria]|uniref:uncharacterized protein LOC128550070 n=1 Tax=Mercenaria mercenaria TaxID=6596 RepID=UPI00234F56FD|nr:uncharacterized protein LOC128550070 [Mercenaria mercenaria]
MASQGSGGSSDSSMTIPEHSASTGNSPRYQFNRQARPYNTIDDEEVKGDQYNRPWDGRTIHANRSAQARSAGTLSGSVREDKKEKNKGLSRSNTTGSRSTKL